jgi:hypothetical protein
MYLTRLPPSSCICNSSHCAPTTYDTVPPFITPPYQAVLDPETGVMLRPLSYPGAARPLMLPLFRLLPYLYLPDHSTAYTGLTSAVAAISMLSSYRPNTSTSVRTMPTFLFCLTFPHLSNHSLTSCYESSPVFLVCVSQFFIYLLRLFCYLLITILRISQPISKLLTVMSLSYLGIARLLVLMPRLYLYYRLAYSHLPDLSRT